MLPISPISFKNYNNVLTINQKLQPSYSSSNERSLPSNAPYAAYVGLNQPSFKGDRIIKNIEFKDYIELDEAKKEEIRDKYDKYYSLVDIDELYQPKRSRIDALPLSTKDDMENFLQVAKGYNNYRKNKIICVGRSPKWFLNASIWMKDGIEDYSFAAFSSNWHRRDRWGVGPKQYFVEDRQPTQEQFQAYKKYMTKIKCDPVTLVKRAQKSGRPIIITDYIHSGCGLASWLDMMAKFAEDAGVKDDFAKSIKLYTMGSIEYIDDLGYDSWYAIPRVILPERLQMYDIPQEFHNMSADVLKSMLIDKNTNECRSTYYPPSAWTVYNPMKYKTGLIPEEILKEMPRLRGGYANTFTNAMKDYRNLMNFRILDYLYTNGLLKEEHKTR